MKAHYLKALHMENVMEFQTSQKYLSEGALTILESLEKHYLAKETEVKEIKDAEPEGQA